MMWLGFLLIFIAIEIIVAIIVIYNCFFTEWLEIQGYSIRKKIAMAIILFIGITIIIGLFILGFYFVRY